MNDDTSKAVEAYIRRDPFAQFLGAEVEILKPGHSRAVLTVTADMINFHGITHGAVVFALADIAFAAAGNSRGQTAVALDVTMHFLKATGIGDRLVAEASEIHAAGPTALYDITVRDARSGALIAKSQDLVYRKKAWFAGG